MEPDSSNARLPELGDVLAGKYRVTSILGRGGMGVVFEGQHEMLGRAVAVKVLAPEVLWNQEAVTRFLNEARAVAKIASEHVVQVLDVGLLDGGLPFMVMERLEGKDMAQLLKEEGLPPVAVAVDLLVEGVEGVAHAHLEGIIHRDLKPSNLFLARRPDRTTVTKVLDFGISKLGSTGGVSGSGGVTSTNAILGSPLYMSPEQLRSSKAIDVRADIWSLGVIGYELLSRTVPFDGDNLVEIFAKIQEREARPLTEVRQEIPADLDRVVRQCLRRDPAERFPSAHALAAALAPFGTERARAAVARLESQASSRGFTPDALGTTLPDQPGIGSKTLEAPKGGTAAPWVTTGLRTLRASGKSGLWIGIGVGVMVVGGVVTAIVSRTNTPSPAAASSSAPDTTDEDQDPEPLAPATVQPTLVVVSPPPATAPPPTPPASASAAARPPAPRPAPTQPAPKPPAPKPAPSDSDNPLKMRPL